MDIGLLVSAAKDDRNDEGIRNFSYERGFVILVIRGDKLLKLHSLESRRVSGNFIKIFKWVKGFNKGDVGKITKVSQGGSNRFKLEKCNLEKTGRNWFTNRVVSAGS